jgi:hypothetical protein
MAPDASPAFSGGVPQAIYADVCIYTEFVAYSGCGKVKPPRLMRRAAAVFASALDRIDSAGALFP